MASLRPYIEVSVNPFMFPARLYSGTEIPAGIMINVEKFVFFGFIRLHKLYIEFNPLTGFVHIEARGGVVPPLPLGGYS